MPEIIAFVDHDDEEWHAVLGLLRERGHEVLTIGLGCLDDELDLRLTLDDFRFSQGDVVVDSEAVRSARVVIYRRWRMAETPIVSSSLAAPAEREFAEREWDAAVSAALRMAEEQSGAAVWCNRFSFDAVARDKLGLLRTANRLGLRVPETIVATVVAAPGTPAVVKSVNVDEAIDAKRSFRTTVLSDELLEAYVGQRSNCPTLLQRKAGAGRELRVVVIGETVEVVAQQVDGAYDDIRYADADRITREHIPPPQELVSKLQKFMRVLQLHYCTFDVLEGGSGYNLVDVTPNGMWTPFETEDVLLSRTIADVIGGHAITVS